MNHTEQNRALYLSSLSLIDKIHDTCEVKSYRRGWLKGTLRSAFQNLRGVLTCLGIAEQERPKACEQSQAQSEVPAKTAEAELPASESPFSAAKAKVQRRRSRPLQPIVGQEKKR